MRDPFSFTIKLRSDRCRITMSGKVSDLPIRSKSALFRQKMLERINFKSGKRGRVLRNPPGVTVGRNLWICEIHGSRCAIYGSLARAGIHGCLRNLWILRRVRSTDLPILISTLP